MTFLINVPNSVGVGFLILGILISSQYSAVSGAVPPRTRDYSRQNDLEPITLQDVLDSKLAARGFSGQWVENSDNLIRVFNATNVVDYNVLDGTNTSKVDLTEIISQVSGFSNLIFSNDGNFALVEHSRTSQWRYSSLAKYQIYDINTKTLTLLEPVAGGEQESLQLVKWAPNNGIVFVYEYNIYYRKDPAPGTAVRQITDDGGNNEEKAIYNGIADWVYEEEMFGGPTALWISKSGTSLAFVKFDDKDVEKYQWPIYNEAGSNISYPRYEPIRYPKAGYANPSADVYLVSLSNDNSQPEKVTYQNTTESDRHLIGTAVWATDDQLLLATLDRVQTKSSWHLCASTTRICRIVHTYGLDNGWVDMNTPKVSVDGTRFLLVTAQKQDPANLSYNHILMFKADGSSATAITRGRLSVTSILGWDETSNKIYFTGSLLNGQEVDPTESHTYSVSDDGANTQVCITCGLKNTAEGLCRENSVIFSAKFTYFIHRCGGPDVPETTTRQTVDGQPIANAGPTFVDNAALREILRTKAVPITKTYTVPVGPNNEFNASVWLWLPANYDETKKYPLLISVYGGPGSQNLAHNYGITWETSLVSDRNIIFGKIDGRGTSKQSTDHMYTLHRNLGTVEIEDQITVLKHLLENEPLIDANRTSIWGWSYGGYATAKVLEKDTENVYKCGISVAPVTNWRYYDTIYTERYMGLPTVEDNYNGYNESDVTTHVENLRNKQFMLVHGNADDNVHYQQSMILTRSMEQNDIFFHQLSYPNENHGISGTGMRRHLYHSLERFLFDECYKTPTPVSPPEGTTDSNDGDNSGSGILSNPAFAMILSSVFIVYHHAF